MDTKRLKFAVLFPSVLLLLSACSGHVRYSQDSAPRYAPNVQNIPDARPRVEPVSRYGNPKSYVVNGRRYHTLSSSRGFVQTGIASWYGTKFHGRLTSNREKYNMYAMTAAHKTLPLPCYVEVTNLDNGRKVVVRVNDRGPFVDDRIIDLSYSAAIKLGINQKGTGHVRLRAIDPRDRNWSAPEPKPVMVKADPAPIPTTPATGESDDDSAIKFLQVGAFSSWDNADQLRKRIMKMSEAMPVQIHRSQDALFQVRVGPLNSDGEAEKFSALLAVMGIENSSLVFD